MKAATVTPRSEREKLKISIHAAREGGDPFCKLRNDFIIRFQSTPPVKAATGDIIAGAALEIISIHAAREGGDLAYISPKIYIKYFNPRRP